MQRSSSIYCDRALIWLYSIGAASAPLKVRASALSFFGRAIGRGRFGRVEGSRAARRKESAVKPGSVGDSHSSGIRVAAQLKRPTRKPMWATCSGFWAARFPIWSCSRWGLPCRWCCHPRGALLPHHFTLTGTACAALRRYLSVALSV